MHLNISYFNGARVAHPELNRRGAAIDGDMKKKIAVIVSVTGVFILVCICFMVFYWKFLGARLSDLFKNTRESDVEMGSGEAPKMTFQQRHLAGLRMWKKPDVAPTETPMPRPADPITQIPLNPPSLVPSQKKLYAGKRMSYFVKSKKREAAQKTSQAATTPPQGRVVGLGEQQQGPKSTSTQKANTSMRDDPYGGVNPDF